MIRLLEVVFFIGSGGLAVSQFFRRGWFAGSLALLVALTFLLVSYRGLIGQLWPDIGPFLTSPPGERTASALQPFNSIPCGTRDAGVWARQPREPWVLSMICVLRGATPRLATERIITDKVLQTDLFDMPKTYPEVTARLRTALTAKIKNLEGVNWAWTFADGISKPLQRVTMEDRHFIAGHVCKVKDCADNQLVFLVEERSSRVYAFLMATSVPGWDAEFVGEPTVDEISAMQLVAGR